jgi:hypothetical protein
VLAGADRNAVVVENTRVRTVAVDGCCCLQMNGGGNTRLAPEKGETTKVE